MKDLFNPRTGEFATNIRDILDGDNTELEQSLEKFGWIKYLPAFKDENGVVIIGHRRLKIAEKLNIEPVIVVLQFGDGDEADAERLKLAIASNLGHKPLTPKDRQRIAEYLYGSQEWTMQRIADALGVTHKTISKDLAEFVPGVQIKPAITESNPKGAGRPKGTKSTRKDRAPQAVAREDKVAMLMDAGMSAREISDEIGLGLRAVNQAMEHVIIKREVEPQIDRGELSLTAQHKLDLAIDRYQRQLDAKFERRVLDEVKRRIDEIVLPEWKRQIAEAKTLYDRRKGIMNKETFNMIRRGLHPDSRKAISDKRLEEAFDAFMKLEKLLLNEQDSPTVFGKLPSSLAEWDRMRAQRPKRSPTSSTVAKR